MPLWFRLLLWVVKAYVFAFTVLLMALIAAYFGGWADALFYALLGDRWQAGWGKYWGWLGGALLAAIGQPLGWIKSTKWLQGEDVDEDKQPDDTPGRPAKVIPTTLFFCLGGCLLGAIIGFSLGVMWFSLAMSPWPREGWFESIEFGSREEDDSFHSSTGDGGSSLSTSHPVALTLVAFPILILGTVGALVGLIGAAGGWITDTTTRKTLRRRRSKGGESVLTEPSPQAELPQLALPPRRVPWRLRLQSVNWFLVVWGTMFFAAGVGVMVLGVFSVLGLLPDFSERNLLGAIFLFGLALPFMAAGAAALYYAARSARTTSRLLRHGRLARATILECRDETSNRWREFEAAFNEVCAFWDKPQHIDTKRTRTLMTGAGCFALLVFSVMGMSGALVTGGAVFGIVVQKEPFAWLVLLFSLAWWALMVWMARSFWGQMREVKSSKKRTLKSFGAKPTVTCRARFSLPEGDIVQFETKVDLTGRLAAGDPDPADVAVYDPHDPQRAMLLSSLSPALSISEDGQWQQVES